MKDKFGIAMLRPTDSNGWEWYNRWGRGLRRTITWGPDRRDSRFQVLGMTRCDIFGHNGVHAGEVRVTGMAPCLFLRGSEAVDIEVTFYAKSGSAATRLHFAGMEAICQPTGRPGQWIGFKVLTRGVASGGNITAEVFVDKTEGVGGGSWKRAQLLKGASMTSNMDGVPDHSLYLRTTGGTEQRYKYFSARQVGTGIQALAPSTEAARGGSMEPGDWADHPRSVRNLSEGFGYRPHGPSDWIPDAKHGGSEAFGW